MSNAQARHGRPGWISIVLAAGLALAAGHGQAATQTRTVAFQYDATTGQRVKEIVEPGSSALCLVTTYGYDAYGNATTSTTRNCNGSVGSHPGINSEAAAPAGDPVFAARTTTTGFDARGQFPTASTNALSQSETREFDPRLGTLTKLTGPNGLVTAWTYDGFGRKTSETLADGTVTTWAYALCSGCGGLTNTAYTVTVIQTGAPTVVTYHDTLDRVLRVQTTGFDGVTAIYQDTQYDALGRVSQRSRPYYAGQTAYWTSYTYDVLGRVATQTAPYDVTGGIVRTVRTRFVYEGLTTKVVRADDQVTPAPQTTTRIRNARGQLATVTDPQGNSVTYTYDPNGNLTQTTDARGNRITLAYDLRGRKTGMVDPDMGSWQYRYNALGELVGQTDAKGQVSSMSYDLLGRMTRRTEPDLVSNWYFDKKRNGLACGKGIGKLCEAVADNAYRREHNYDALGRPSSATTTLDAIYTGTVTYDTLGRIATRTWPTGFSVKYGYTALGYLKDVRKNDASNALYWQANAFDAGGHLTNQTQGNGIVTQRNFDPASGQLEAILAGAANGVQNQTYLYDALGNLKIRQDNVTATLEGFAYDLQNRLTDYSLQGPGVTGVVNRTVAYDAIGNITNKSDTGAYYYTPGLPPHQVASVTSAQLVGAQPAQSWAHTYDGNGNLIFTVIDNRVTNTQLMRAETYTSYNMPLTLNLGPVGQAATKTLSFVHGPEHQRIKEHSNVTGTTYYVHGTDGQALDFERVVPVTGPMQNKHYITAGNKLVAIHVSRSDGTQSLRYLHLDHLGSSSVITDDVGNVVERLAYDPWGKRRSANGATPPEGFAPTNTERGFTMHEHLDEMGVIHMNGRVYDPILGRFMSADPFIQDPNDQRAFNRYSYAWNNPLGATDPSGFVTELSEVRVEATPLPDRPERPSPADRHQPERTQPSTNSSQVSAVPHPITSSFANNGINFMPSGVAGVFANSCCMYLNGATLAWGSDEFPNGLSGEWSLFISLYGSVLPIPGVVPIIGASAVKLFGILSGSAAKGVASLNPASVRFSQSSVNGVEEIAASMRANGWQGAPIDAVRMSDGALTTFDNTRVLAAQRAGIDVQAVIREAGEAFPVGRWTPRNGIQPATWENAVRARIQQQNSGFRNTYPNGSPYTGSTQ